jgi:hypothetical protein
MKDSDFLPLKELFGNSDKMQKVYLNYSSPWCKEDRNYIAMRPLLARALTWDCKDRPTVFELALYQPPVKFYCVAGFPADKEVFLKVMDWMFQVVKTYDFEVQTWLLAGILLGLVWDEKTAPAQSCAVLWIANRLCDSVWLSDKDMAKMSLYPTERITAAVDHILTKLQFRLWNCTLWSELSNKVTAQWPVVFFVCFAEVVMGSEYIRECQIEMEKLTLKDCCEKMPLFAGMLWKCCPEVSKLLTVK